MCALTHRSLHFLEVFKEYRLVCILILYSLIFSFNVFDTSSYTLSFYLTAIWYISARKLSESTIRFLARQQLIKVDY